MNKTRFLYKGIFWITNIEEPSSELCFSIPCDSNGNIVGDTKYQINAKSKTTYNHENLWKQLPSNLTNNKPFNYYPRGRVEIINGKAVIYANPILCIDEIKKILISTFNLNEFNGIKKVIMKADGSEHYKCHYDD